MKTMIRTAYILGLFFISGLASWAQTSQGIGTNNPNPKAVLDVSSSTQGILLPRMTLAQKNTLALTLGATEVGLTVFDLNDKFYYTWDGTTFQPLQQGADLWSKAGSNIFPTALADNIGVGTNTPGYKLEVNGTLKSAGITESSDIRWKKDIMPIENALSKVLKLRGVTYNWRKEEFKEKNFDAKPQIGLIAQEVEKIIPQVVNTDKQGFKSVEYSKLVALLIEAIKEQELKITKLTQENLEFKASVEGNDKILQVQLSSLQQRLDAIDGGLKSSKK